MPVLNDSILQLKGTRIEKRRTVGLSGVHSTFYEAIYVLPVYARPRIAGRARASVRRQRRREAMSTHRGFAWEGVLSSEPLKQYLRNRKCIFV